MKIYHLMTGNIDGKPSHYTVGDKRDWFYIPNMGIIIRRYKDSISRKGPNYWFSQDKNHIKQVEDFLSGENKNLAFKLVGNIVLDTDESSILEEIISHAQVYTSEQKNFVSKVRMFDKHF